MNHSGATKNIKTNSQVKFNDLKHGLEVKKIMLTAQISLDMREIS